MHMPHSTASEHSFFSGHCTFEDNQENVYTYVHTALHDSGNNNPLHPPLTLTVVWSLGFHTHTHTHIDTHTHTHTHTHTLSSVQNHVTHQWIVS